MKIWERLGFESPGFLVVDRPYTNQWTGWQTYIDNPWKSPPDPRILRGRTRSNAPSVGHHPHQSRVAIAAVHTCRRGDRDPAALCPKISRPQRRLRDLRSHRRPQPTGFMLSSDIKGLEVTYDLLTAAQFDA